MTLLCIIVYYYRHNDILSKTSVQFRKLVELFSSDTIATESRKFVFYDFVGLGIENYVINALS